MMRCLSLSLLLLVSLALAWAPLGLSAQALSAEKVDAELVDLDIGLEATYAPHSRQLTATCKRYSKRQYYGTKYLLEEIDITGKNRDKSCCWYCSKTCGCKKWDYERLGDGTELCKLFDRKAKWKKYKGGRSHYGGFVN